MKLFVHAIAESILNNTDDFIVMFHSKDNVTDLRNTFFIRILLKLTDNSHDMTNRGTQPQIIFDGVQKVDKSDDKSYIWATIPDKVYKVGFRVSFKTNSQSDIYYCHVFKETR